MPRRAVIDTGDQQPGLRRVQRLRALQVSRAGQGAALVLEFDPYQPAARLPLERQSTAHAFQHLLYHREAQPAAGGAAAGIATGKGPQDGLALVNGNALIAALAAASEARRADAKAALERVPSSMLEASADLGASRAQTFRTGDAFLIPDGFRGYWEVIETTTKHFVIRSYTPG